MTLLLLSGVVIGFVLGLTGAGGGMFAVPALAACLGWSMQQAIPVALIAVAFGSTIAVIDGLRQKLVRYRAAVLMACVGLLFTAWGMRLSAVLSQRWLTGVFAMVMLYVAVNLIRDVKGSAAQEIPLRLVVGRLNTDTGRFNWTWLTAVLFSGIGALSGLLTGLLGIGGGFVIVPMLQRFTDASIRVVVATSLLMIALIASGGVITALLQGAELPFQETLVFTTAIGVGIVIARSVAGYFSENQIRFGFALMLIGVALALFWRMLYLP